MESSEKLEGKIVQLYKDKQRKIVNKELNFIEELLQGDNIVSQIAKLVYTIIMEWLEQMVQMQKKIIEQTLQANPDDPEVKKKLFLQKVKLKQARVLNTFDFFFTNTAHIDVVRNDRLELVE